MNSPILELCRDIVPIDSPLQDKGAALLLKPGYRQVDPIPAAILSGFHFHGMAWGKNCPATNLWAPQQPKFRSSRRIRGDN